MLASTAGRLQSPFSSLFFLKIVLLALVLSFLVPGIAGLLRDASARRLSVRTALGVCKLALAASVCGLHLSRCAAATQLWALHLKRPRDGFTDFRPLARRAQLYTLAAALLLFALVLKVGIGKPGKPRLARQIIVSAC